MALAALHSITNIGKIMSIFVFERGNII